MCENFAGNFGGYCPGGPIAWNCFHICHSPQGNCLRRCFCSFLPHYYFFRFLFIFMYLQRTIQLLYINIFTDVFVITLRYTSLKKPINSIFPSVGSHFKVFLRRLIVWYAPLFLRMTPSHLLTFFTVDCCSTLILKVLRNASQQLSLCWSIWELNLGLEKRETFSWYIAWMPLYYCGVH